MCVCVCVCVLVCFSLCVIVFFDCRIYLFSSLAARVFNKLTRYSLPPHLCSTSSQHSLFISGYPRSTTNIIQAIRITDRSFPYASPCLWNQLPSSLNQPHLSPSVCPACSCFYHISSLCQLTTLTIHNSLFLSLTPQDLPLSQNFPTIDSLPASGLTPRTSRPDRFF